MSVVILTIKQSITCNNLPLTVHPFLRVQRQEICSTPVIWLYTCDLIAVMLVLSLIVHIITKPAVLKAVTATFYCLKNSLNGSPTIHQIKDLLCFNPLLASDPCVCTKILEKR